MYISLFMITILLLIRFVFYIARTLNIIFKTKTFFKNQDDFENILNKD
jgi:hypothetical protein